MDNKRWGKRFSTIFWWSLTILPLIVALIYFIGYHLTFNSGINTAQELADYHSHVNGNFLYILDNYIRFANNNGNVFELFTLPFLRIAFTNLFTSLSVSKNVLLGALFGWMASVQMYHLLFDFFAWLPRLFHSWMDRWCVE